MKSLLITLGLAVAVSTTSLAQASLEKTKEVKENAMLKNTSNPKVIKFEEAPIAVQNAFKAEKYPKENIVEVQEVTEASTKTYKIIIEKDAQKWALKFDEKGTLLEKKEAK
ncbi:PepSY-like domain-containing protein [Marivirga lumbricoides]